MLILPLQYAKSSLTSTAYDPYATDFQYIIDSFIRPKWNDYIYQGCYSDTFGVLLADRALNAKSANVGVGSVEKCGQFCEGFTFFGLENGNECECKRWFTPVLLLTTVQATVAMRSRTEPRRWIVKEGEYHCRCGNNDHADESLVRYTSSCVRCCSPFMDHVEDRSELGRELTPKTLRQVRCADHLILQNASSAAAMI